MYVAVGEYGGTSGDAASSSQVTEPSACFLYDRHGCGDVPGTGRQVNKDVDLSSGNEHGAAA